MYDVAIIGAGVMGCAIARELSRYQLQVLLLEKDIDVGVGATKANSGIVHGGYTAAHGTLKGELVVKGNRMYRQLEEELNFGFRQTGSLVVAFTDEEREILAQLQANGEKNGVQDLRILQREEALAREPALNPAIVAALYCGETGITSPYEFCIALAENAVANGVTLALNNEVKHIESKAQGFQLVTGADTYQARYVINAAGVYADTIAAMVGAQNFTILPRKGQYLLLSRGTGSLVNHVVFQTPGPQGKGVLVTSTYWGNLMLGPNAEDVTDREDLATETTALRDIIATAWRSVPQIDITKAIRSFSGIRPSSDRRDFIIEESRVPRFINVAGIDSPGLTSAPAIAQRVLQLLEELEVVLEPKADFNPRRRPITTFSPLQPMSEIVADVNRPPGDPLRIVCRCEQVREQTIVDAIHRGIPINSTDAIKRRTRAGMGACQGSFCTSRVKEIIARERGLAPEEIFLRGRQSGDFPARISSRELRQIAQGLQAPRQD